MSLTQKLLLLSVLIIVLLTFVRECRCEVCDIDFHRESPSVLLLEGENGTVLCDGTCFEGETSARVTWLDSRGQEVNPRPGRVFSVRYNRGLMNRLLIIDARTESAGNYICSVARSGDVLRQKHINVLVLASNGGPSVVLPGNTGPRRGDITPRRDVDYREVRSVERALSRLGTSKVSKPGTRERNFYVDKNTDREMKAEVDNPFLKLMAEKRSSLGGNLTKFLTDYKKKQEVSEITAVKINNKTARGLRKKDILRNFLGNKKNTQYQIEKLDPSINEVLSDQPIQRSNNLISISIRSKRQSNTNQTEEADNTTKSSTGNEIGNTTSLYNSTTSGESDYSNNSSYNPQNTDSDEEFEGTSKDTGADETIASRQGQTSTTSCRQEHELSNFGTYGVLAFAISLAVAFLLFYTILMIIFMPRIMARRKKKENIECATYRKKGPETEVLAFKVVDSPDDVGDNSSKGAQQTKGDKNVSQDKQGEATKKEKETKENNASMSTFLLRQDAQSGNSVGSLPDVGTSSSPNSVESNHSEPEAEMTGTAAQKAPEKDAPAQDIPRTSDLYNSLLAELDTADSAASSKNQSNTPAEATTLGTDQNSSVPLATDLPPLTSQSAGSDTVQSAV